MSKLCRQVSIESPGPIVKDCVFSFEVPVPDVPPNGARIRVSYTINLGIAFIGNRPLSHYFLPVFHLSSPEPSGAWNLTYLNRR